MQVGRRLEQRVRSGGAQDALNHRCGRAFALAPGNVDGVARIRPVLGVEERADMVDIPLLRLGGVTGALEPAVVEQASNGTDVRLKVAIARHMPSVSSVPVERAT